MTTKKTTKAKRRPAGTRFKPSQQYGAVTWADLEPLTGETLSQARARIEGAVMLTVADNVADSLPGAHRLAAQVNGLWVGKRYWAGWLHVGTSGGFSDVLAMIRASVERGG